MQTVVLMQLVELTANHWIKYTCTIDDMVKFNSANILIYASCYALIKSKIWAGRLFY